MDSTSGAALEVNDDDEWELINDDGFIYRRQKRQRLEEPATAPASALPVTDPEVEARQRREWKREALLRLKSEYQREIDRWEFLSNTLRVMQEKNGQIQSRRNREDELEQRASILCSPSRAQDASGLLVDELISQAEAQDAIIRDFSNLCDVAEAMCSAQEERLKQSFIDLPIWASSPRELMASLCDD